MQSSGAQGWSINPCVTKDKVGAISSVSSSVLTPNMYERASSKLAGPMRYCDAVTVSAGLSHSS